VRNEDDRVTHERANSDLHRTIIEAAGSRRLLEMYEALNAHIKIARIHSAEANWPVRLEQEQSEHEEIVAALENRDAEALIPALRKHIYRAKDALVATLRGK
jgi:DNA-binding GntR family transcriptional regulator